MNRGAESSLRVDGKSSPNCGQPLPHTGQAEPGPPHHLVRIKAGARVLDCQIDGVVVTVQRDENVSRRAMLDDILQGFLQDSVETEGDLPWQRWRDVVDVDVNRYTMPIGQLLAKISRRVS